MMTELNKIFADETPGNTWNTRTPQKISTVGVNGNPQGNIGNACGISETSSPDLVGIIEITAPPCGINIITEIGNKRESATPYFRNSNKLDTSIDRQFNNNLVTPPILTEVLGDKLSEISIWDIYTHCRVSLVADTINISSPQFVHFGISTINALDKGASLWNPATIFGRPTHVAYGSVPYYIFEKI